MFFLDVDADLSIDRLESTAISAAVAYYCSVPRSTVRGDETERDLASMDN